jgi:hypothetical protein
MVEFFGVSPQVLQGAAELTPPPFPLPPR